MNRIEERFASLRAAGKKGFVVYIGAGDPHLDATHDLAVAFDRAGVDVLELGVPFSDPLADGVVNQLAAQRGIESGTTPPKVLATVKRLRESSQIPVVFYVYFNMVHKRGLERWIADCKDAGVDGLLILDLPPEEADEYQRLMEAAGLCPIWLMAPTTPEARVKLIASRGKGFIYYISREGVTGMQSKVSGTIGSMTATIRKHTDLPIAIGFGVSNPEQAKEVAAHADGVVVGSAIVNQIAEHGQSPDLVPHLAKYVGAMADAVKSI